MAQKSAQAHAYQYTNIYQHTHSRQNCVALTDDEEEEESAGESKCGSGEVEEEQLGAQRKWVEVVGRKRKLWARQLASSNTGRQHKCTYKVEKGKAGQ